MRLLRNSLVFLCLFLSVQSSYSFLPNRRTETKKNQLVSAQNRFRLQSSGCQTPPQTYLADPKDGFRLHASLQDDKDTFSPFEKASTAFEAAHAEDPRTITITNNTTLPYSVHYHRRMAYWLDQLEPNAPEVVKLASRCQHIRRWTRPRADYPKGLKAYKQWRSDLQTFHAQQAKEILLSSGYTEEIADRVGELLGKQNLDSDADVQLLEDVICIVFLENEYTAFIEQEEYEDRDDKLVNIVQKTWKKMTPRGHEAALQLAGQLTERGLRVVERAVAMEE